MIEFKTNAIVQSFKNIVCTFIPYLSKSFLKASIAAQISGGGLGFGGRLITK